MMHGHEKSRFAIVAMKPTNKAELSAAERSAVGPAAAEPVERRAEAEGNAGQQSTHRAQYRVRVTQALACIRRACRRGYPRWEPYAGKLHVRICAGGAQ
jgi:hypothetical protein